MRLLITGAGGMLGQDVHSAATAAGHQVSALTRAELDIIDGAAVRAAFEAARPDAVINCAAYTQVDKAENEAEAAKQANAVAPGVLAGAAAEAGAWLVHVSTDYVFDGQKTGGPYLESDPVGPRSVYGSTKLEGERAIAAALPDAHTIVRSAWLFGLHGPCFPATMLRLAGERDQLRVVADQRGCPTYTPHLAGALVSLAEARSLVGVVHVAAAGEASWQEFAAATISGAGLDTRVDPISTAEYPTPAARPAYSVLRSERGAPVLPSWQQGLSEYLTARGSA
ncbi:MAG: dTDP-4-dehydrorhamnose reductase [Solirubrobacterales bacterium]|nr:dTDP-4-dehydrorhamnose reductase [Solirubrobacterales bacterium]